MKRTILLAAGLFLFAGWGTGAPQDAKAPPRASRRNAPATPSGPGTDIRHVIMISVDGMMPESYTSPGRHGLKAPTLREMAEHGVASDGVRGVMPAVTYASHTTIATGVSPRAHGIIANTVFDPLGTKDGEWFWYAEEIRVPTLWDAARAKGLRTALISWPVTVGAQAGFVLPEFWRGTGADGVKLLRAISTPGLFAAVENRFPKFLEGIAPPNTKDEALTDAAVQIIEAARPDLLMLHIFEVDHWQHEKGPWSPEALAAIENADQQIARVVRPALLLRQKGLITLDDKTQRKIIDWKAQILSSSGSAYIYLKDPGDVETQRMVKEIFLPLAGKPGSGIARVLTAEDIAVLGGDSGAFLGLEAAEGYGFVRDVNGEYETAALTPGLHGFPPDNDAMRSSLLFYGPAIGAGRINNARMMDIAPTVAKWLGLRLEKAEGVSLAMPMKK